MSRLHSHSPFCTRHSRPHTPRILYGTHTTQLYQSPDKLSTGVSTYTLSRLSAHCCVQLVYTHTQRTGYSCRKCNCKWKKEGTEPSLCAAVSVAVSIQTGLYNSHGAYYVSQAQLQQDQDSWNRKIPEIHQGKAKGRARAASGEGGAAALRCVRESATRRLSHALSSTRSWHAHAHARAVSACPQVQPYAGDKRTPSMHRTHTHTHTQTHISPHPHTPTHQRLIDHHWPSLTTHTAPLYVRRAC